MFKDARSLSRSLWLASDTLIQPGGSRTEKKKLGCNGIVSPKGIIMKSWK